MLHCNSSGALSKETGMTALTICSSSIKNSVIISHFSFTGGVYLKFTCYSIILMELWQRIVVLSATSSITMFGKLRFSVTSGNSTILSGICVLGEMESSMRVDDADRGGSCAVSEAMACINCCASVYAMTKRSHTLRIATTTKSANYSTRRQID